MRGFFLKAGLFSTFLGLFLYALFQNTDALAANPVGKLSSHLTVGDKVRSFDLFVPSTYVPTKPMPLVLNFHGGAGNAESAERMTGISEYAERYGFIVAYPNGSGMMAKRFLTWNSGNCCGYAHREEVDDVGFTRALIAHLEQRYAINPKKIYATGISNGGMMSYRLACELSDKIAAVAPVAGALNLPTCQPKKPVAIIAFHGTADQHVLYEGGKPKKQIDPTPRTDRSVLDSIGLWVKRNRCNPKPRHQVVGGTVTLDAYENCFLGADVQLYTIQGGGHVWPGGGGYPFSDPPVDDVNATDLIVKFFLSHSHS